MRWTGCGELTQLKFEDIDWENKLIRIVSDKSRKTKNRKSRVIPLSSDLAEELKFLWEYYPIMDYGKGGLKTPYRARSQAQQEYVFCHPDGRPIQCIRNSLKKLFKKVGIEGVSPHGLRKTFCTLLARNKVHPKVAQELLGHSNIRLTMDIYTEVGDEQKIEAVKTLPTCRELAQKKLQVIEGAIS